jgi:demethylmenaquinone methyltransferase/2-methoxy-6-polyprenyl-1,4-benzoquinol methylase
VARRYDLMNDLMSGGVHRAWKSALVTAVNPPKNDRPFALLDVAGGTGDIAFRVVAAGGPGTRATVCDINEDMLAVGRERAAEQGLSSVSFEQGNAEDLPYSDRSFDCVTIAFGIRNVPRIERALAEMARVLRIGGRFLCLEFSSVDVPGIDKLYDLYSYQVIPRVGEAVTGDREAYQYLVESIRKFSKPKVFARMIEAAGFRRVTVTPMTGGVVALHSGWKL